MRIKFTEPCTAIKFNGKIAWANISQAKGDCTANVFFFFLSKIQENNHVYCTQKDTAEEMGISRAAALHAIHRLIETDVLAMKGHGDYIMNPDIAFIGGCKADKKQEFLEAQNKTQIA